MTTFNPDDTGEFVLTLSEMEIPDEVAEEVVANRKDPRLMAVLDGEGKIRPGWDYLKRYEMYAPRLMEEPLPRRRKS